MIGPTGVGKSRLAIEWLQSLRESGWDVGVAAPDSSVPDGWRARRPTAIVIDEAGREWVAALGPALQRLAEAARPKAPVRVLIVDVIEPNTNSVQGAARETVRVARADAPMALSGLGDAAFKTLWTCAGGRLSATDDELAFLREETAGRPRALLLVTRASPGTTYTQALADWAANLLPELADAPGDAGAIADRKRLKALALAALAGPLSVQAARSALDGVFESAPLARFFPTDTLAETLPALVPEDLGQEILLRALAFLDEPECEAIASTAFAADSEAQDRVERVLSSLWAERPEADSAVAAAHATLPAAATPMENRARSLARLQAAFDEAHPQRVTSRREESRTLLGVTAASDLSLEDLEPALARLAQIVERYPADREIRFKEAKGAVNAISHYGMAGEFDDLERWGGRLIALADTPTFAADREVRFAEAMGAYNAMLDYGAAKRFDDLERWGGRLIAIADTPAFAADREIRHHEAMGAVNAISHYGTAERFDDLERWGGRMIAIADTPAFAADREIRHHEAMGAVNAISHYGTAERFDDLERWGGRMIAIADTPAFAADREIRHHEAMGAVNAMLQYGAAKRFDDLERWGDRLIAIADTPEFATDREIRLKEAMGAYNAMPHYGRVERFNDLERWGGRLIAIADTPEFATDREIRLAEARAVHNALTSYGAAKRFDDLERWGGRLIAIADTPAFAANREIRLAEAKGIVNAMFECGRAERFDDLERWGGRLIALADTPAFATDREIRHAEAMGAKNALVSYARFVGGRSDARAAWRNRLAAVARELPGVLDIQQIAKDFGLSFAEQAGSLMQVPIINPGAEAQARKVAI